MEHLCFRVVFVLVLVVAFAGFSHQQVHVEQDQQQPSPEDTVPQSDISHLVNDLLKQRDPQHTFTMSAAVIQAVQRYLKRKVTLLVPTNQALQQLDASQLSQRDIFSTMERHVITFPVQFSTLEKEPVGTELPTMLGDSLHITSTEPGNFAIENVNVSVPDLCQSTSFLTCHGIDGVIVSRAAQSPGGGPVSEPESGAPSPRGPVGPSTAPSSATHLAAGTSVFMFLVLAVLGFHM